MFLTQKSRTPTGAKLVYFDGRLADSAVLLARAARARGVPVLVEAERLRDQLDELLMLADFVVTSTGFPSAWTGAAAVEDALPEMAARLPHVRMMITTLGSKGSVMVEVAAGAAEAKEAVLSEA